MKGGAAARRCPASEFGRDQPEVAPASKWPAPAADANEESAGVRSPAGVRKLAGAARRPLLAARRRGGGYGGGCRVREVEFELLQLGGHDDPVRARPAASQRARVSAWRRSSRSPSWRGSWWKRRRRCVSVSRASRARRPGGSGPSRRGSGTRRRCTGSRGRRARRRVPGRILTKTSVRAARTREGEFLIRDVAERRGPLTDPVAEGGTGVRDGAAGCGPKYQRPSRHAGRDSGRSSRGGRGSQQAGERSGEAPWTARRGQAGGSQMTISASGDEQGAKKPRAPGCGQS